MTIESAIAAALEKVALPDLEFPQYLHESHKLLRERDAQVARAAIEAYTEGKVPVAQVLGKYHTEGDFYRIEATRPIEVGELLYDIPPPLGESHD